MLSLLMILLKCLVRLVRAEAASKKAGHLARCPAFLLAASALTSLTKHFSRIISSDSIEWWSDSYWLVELAEVNDRVKSSRDIGGNNNRCNRGSDRLTQARGVHIEVELEFGAMDVERCFIDPQINA